MELIKVSATLVLLMSVGLYYVSKQHALKRLPIVEGFFQPEFMKLAVMLRNNMESDIERGGSVAVYHGGELVLDMWMGYADGQSLRRWRNETTTLAFGCTSAATAAVVALLIDRGILNISMPVSHYWPEFAANGKQGVTVEMLLGNQVELLPSPGQISLRDLQENRKQIETQLASCKHRLTSDITVTHTVETSLVLDAFIRRIDPQSRDITTFFEEEVAKPWGIEFDMRLKPEDVFKTARLEREVASHYFSSYLPNILMSWTQLLNVIQNWVKGQPLIVRSESYIKELTMPVTVLNDYELREITLLTLSGTGTARGLARLYSVFATRGYLGNRQVLKQDTVNIICPMVESNQSPFGTGGHGWQNVYGDTVCGYMGYGGQVVMADPKNHLSMAYMSNFLSLHSPVDDPRLNRLLELLYTCLESYTHRLKQSGG